MQKTFTGRTLEEAMKTKDAWLSTRKVTIKNEYPVEVRRPAGRFGLKATAKSPTRR